MIPLWIALWNTSILWDVDVQLSWIADVYTWLAPWIQYYCAENWEWWITRLNDRFLIWTSLSSSEILLNISYDYT